MLINRQSNKGYLKIGQTSIGSGKVEKKKKEGESKNERGRRELFSLEMQIHWNEFRRDVRLSQYSVRRKERGISAACFSSSFSSSAFPLSPSLPFLTSSLALCLLCLCLPTEKEFFELIFSRRRVIFPERVFTFSSARWLHPPPPLLSFTLSALVSFFLSISFCFSHRSYPTKMKEDAANFLLSIIATTRTSQLLYQI